MNTIFAKLLYEMEKQRDTMLVSIISRLDSAPRGVGSQMLVGLDGRLLGTIGGGAVEKKSEELALRLLAEKRSGVHEFQLRADVKESIGMVCGGDVAVLLQYIPGTDQTWNALAGQLLALIAAGKPGWLVQDLSGGAPSLLDGDGAVLAGAAVDPCLCGRSAILTAEKFSLPLLRKERAVIFGAGHCGQALAPILSSIGFRVTVFDDRPEYALPAHFSAAEAVICGDYDNIAEHLTLTAEDYIVVMTSGHAFDLAVQAQVLRQPKAYVGVIGSKKKTAAVNARLMELGITEEATHCVHTPIGTPIKAVTPEEIAVSIAGEMILVRALRREGNSE